MKIAVRFGCMLISFWLTSCTFLQPAALAPQNKSLGWSTREQTLSQIKTWNLKGLIAIRTDKGADSASLNWQQHNQHYMLSLFGPLGTNAYKLSGFPGKVTLINPKGQTFSADSPEQLLAQQTGWRLPLSNLNYWIRGLPAPGAATKQLDQYNHIIQMHQGSWEIRYLRYTSVGNHDLPNKIFINSPQLSVKIIISEWQI